MSAINRFARVVAFWLSDLTPTELQDMLRRPSGIRERLESDLGGAVYLMPRLLPQRDVRAIAQLTDSDLEQLIDHIAEQVPADLGHVIRVQRHLVKEQMRMIRSFIVGKRAAVR